MSEQMSNREAHKEWEGHRQRILKAARGRQLPTRTSLQNLK